MTRPPGALGSDAGFSLVETMWALLVFSIITLGTVPLLLGSLRGATLSRSYTVGKSVAQEAIERLRDLPYYISYSSQDSKVDVLDLYFPGLTGGYDAATKTFTTTCTPATSASAPCPKALAAGYTVAFEAQFVNPTTATPETYNAVAPAAGYVWSSAVTDAPPSQLLKVSVLVQWTQSGTTKSYRVDGIVGDRAFGLRTKLRGTAEVGYGIQALTSYVVGSAQKDLTVIGGASRSETQAGLSSSADQSVEAGSISVNATTPAALLGAVSEHHAPPDAAPAGVTKAAQTFVDTAATPTGRGFINTTTTVAAGSQPPLGVAVAGEQPLAQGPFSYSTAVAPGNPEELLWVSNTVTSPPNSLLRLPTTAVNAPTTSVRLMSVLPLGTPATTLSGSSTTSTTAADVVSSARTDIGRILVLPTTFIATTYHASGPVLVLDNFTADVSCNARGVPSGAWSATLSYWRDATQDNARNGAYVTVSLGVPQPAGQDTLAAIKAQNGGKGPLIYDGNNAAADVFLFEVGTSNGYLTDWSSLSAVAVRDTANNRETSALIDGAIRMTTIPLDNTVGDSTLGISIGNVGCGAVDYR